MTENNEVVNDAYAIIHRIFMNVANVTGRRIIEFDHSKSLLQIIVRIR